jgi:hypothetical protein
LILVEKRICNAKATSGENAGRFRSRKMLVLNKAAVMTAMVILCAPTLAQENDELAKNAREAEVRLAEQAAEHAARTVEVQAAEAARQAEVAKQPEAQHFATEQHEAAFRMQEAERRLAEAARQVADLSMAQLPRVERLERIIRANRGPMLGVSISAADNSGPVEGVEILGVSPGGAAADAGLRAGDIITSINDESLTAASSEEANTRLLDFMQGVEEGDSLNVEFLRDGKSQSASISPRSMDNNVFAFNFDGDEFSLPDVHVAPHADRFSNFIWRSDGDGFGAMELAPLSERLGRYFGTNEGLLVVSAPGDKDLQLEDGDVILNIDGRKPTSVAHAMRILGSYESGEELEIEIMRDKRKRKIKLVIPDNRSSAVAPDRVPQAPTARPAKVVVIERDRT